MRGKAVSKTRRLPRLLVVCVVVAMGGSFTACSRSTESYCKAVADHREQYLSAMQSASAAGGLEALLGATVAVADLKSMWRDMATAAPEEIRPDTETVRDTWDQVSEAALRKDWLAAVGAMMQGVAPMQRVDQYVSEKCGASYSFTGSGMRPSSNSTPASVTPTPSEPPADAASATLHEVDSQAWNRSDATIYTGCSDEFEGDLPTGKVLEPVSGAYLPLPVPTVPEGEDLIGGQCLVAGPADHLRAVYLLRTRTPASGLDPAKNLTRFISLPIVPGGETIVRNWPTKWEPALLRGAENVVLAWIDGNIQRNQVAAIDYSTGKLLWQRGDAGEVEAVAPGGVLLVKTGMSEEGIILEPSTGAVIARVEVRNFRELPTGISIEDSEYRFSWFSGGRVRSIERAAAADFGTRLLLSDDEGFVVVDGRSLKTILKRRGSDFEGLGAHSITLSGNYLYLAAKDGSSVIDIRTREIMAETWSSRPTERLSSGWTIVHDAGGAEAEPDQCFQLGDLTCDARSVRLIKDVDGRYPGPWW